MSPDHMSTEESVVSGTVRCAEAASSAKEVGSVNCANETEANVSRSVSSRLRGRGFSVLGDSISTLMGWVPEGGGFIMRARFTSMGSKAPKTHGGGESSITSTATW